MAPMAGAPGPARVLRALALLGCCALARGGIGDIKEYGEDGYHTELKDIDPSHGQLKQLNNNEKGFDPDVVDYTVRIDDETVEKVVLTIVLDFKYYNLMYTPGLHFDNGNGTGMKPVKYSPLDVIRLEVNLTSTDSDKDEDRWGAYDKTVYIKLTDPTTEGKWSGEEATTYNVRILQPPFYKQACQAQDIVVRNSTAVKESTPKFDKDNAEHSYEYLFNDTTAYVKFECRTDIPGVQAKIDGEVVGESKKLDLKGDMRHNLVATCEYHDVDGGRNDPGSTDDKDPLRKFPSQIRSYDLVIQRRTLIDDMASWVKEVRMTSDTGFCYKKALSWNDETWKEIFYGSDAPKTCCNWDDVVCVACKRGKELGIPAEESSSAAASRWCEEHPEEKGCGRFVTSTTTTVTTTATTTTVTTTKTTTKAPNPCGDKDVRDCQARKDAKNTEHQWCIFHPDTKGCQNWKHDKGRRLEEHFAYHEGYVCEVVKGKPGSFVAIIAGGSPDTFLVGKMNGSATPTRKRLMNGVPLPVNVSESTHMSLNVQSGVNLVKIPIHFKLPAMCSSVTEDPNFCDVDDKGHKLVPRTHTCDQLECADEYMCKSDPCTAADDKKTCCARPVSCEHFDAKDAEGQITCRESEAGLPRHRRPELVLGKHMCKSNICDYNMDSDACCTTRDYEINGTVTLKLQQDDEVYLPGCYAPAKIVKIEDDGEHKCGEHKCGEGQRCVQLDKQCDKEQHKRCWTPAPGDTLRLDGQGSIITGNQPGDKEMVEVAVAPNEMYMKNGYWTWVFLPGDLVELPKEGSRMMQAGEIYEIVDAKKGEFTVSDLDKARAKIKIKPGWTFWAFDQTFLGEVIAGPREDFTYLVNFTKKVGLQEGTLVVTKGARAQILRTLDENNMYTVKYYNETSGNYITRHKSYPIPAYDVHIYHPPEKKTNTSASKESHKRGERYKPGDRVDVGQQGSGIVVLAPPTGPYMITFLSDGVTRPVKEGDIASSLKEGGLAAQMKDSVEGPVIGTMRLGSAWSLPMALAMVGAVTAIALFALRRQPSCSLVTPSRDLQRLSQMDQDELLAETTRP